MPCCDAACSAWLLICSISRSVIRLMSRRPPAERRAVAARLVRRLALRFADRVADRHPHVAAVQADLDHPVAERGGHLGGEVGQRVHDR